MRASTGIGWAGLLVAAAIWAGCGTATQSARRERTGELAVRDFCTSFGRRRGFAFENLFADSARLDIAGLKVSFVGREGIARLADYGVAVNARLTAGDFRAAGESVFCRVSESNDWLDLLAVRSATYDGSFRVAGGRIQGARLGLVPESREELSGKLAGFLTWLVSEDPKALEQLLPGGRPTYDASVVPELMRRLRQWRARRR